MESERQHDPVNIGNPHEMTIEQIAREILRLTGSSSRIVYRPLPEDDPKVRQPDITRARTLLGWEPKVPLEEGLKKTLDYFDGRRSESETTLATCDSVASEHRLEPSKQRARAS